MKIHLIEYIEDSEKVWAVSVLPPAGDIPAEGIVGRVKTVTNPILPSEFTPNAQFLKLLHQCIERFGPESPKLIQEAIRQVDGIIYVIDGRNKNPLGQVPREDIMGAFEVRGGRVHSETYRSNPNYKLYTAAGFFLLDKFIEEKLLQELMNRK